MKQYVKISLTVMLLASAEFGFGQTVALLTPSDMSKTVNVSVSVAKKARIEVLRASNLINIDNESIARGYVDLPQAIVLKLWCNSLDGSRVMGQMNKVIYNDDGMQINQAQLMYRVSGEKEYQSFNGSLQDIYEGAGIERGASLSIDVRLVLSQNTPVGEYSFKASFVAEPK